MLHKSFRRCYATIVEGSRVEKFEMFLMKALWEQNDKFQPCVGLDCECAVSLKCSYCPVAVECTCGTCFCFTCQQEPHDPVHSCEVAKTWLDKVAAEGESVSWCWQTQSRVQIVATDLEERRLYAHVLLAMSHLVLLACLGPWDTKHYVCLKRCNRYKADKDSKQQRAQDAKIRLYITLNVSKHMQLQVKKRRTTSKIQIKHAPHLDKLQRTSAQQVSLVMDALKQVARCRRILKWTYACICRVGR